jgi:hypothetical protein
MACLNEHETFDVCVQKAVGALTQSGLAGEVIVADNGNTDGSVKILRVTRCSSRQDRLKESEANGRSRCLVVVTSLCCSLLDNKTTTAN